MTRPLRHGEPWGHAATSPPDVEVAGDDADLVAAAVSRPGALVRFRPSPRSDLARALGLGSDGSGATEVAIDALAIDRRRQPRRTGQRRRCRQRGGARAAAGSAAVDRPRGGHHGARRRAGVVQRPRHHRGRGERPVPAGSRPRSPWPPGRRLGRGPGVRARAPGAPRDAPPAPDRDAPASPRRPQRAGAPGRDRGRRPPPAGRGRRTPAGPDGRGSWSRSSRRPSGCSCRRRGPGSPPSADPSRGAGTISVPSTGPGPPHAVRARALHPPGAGGAAPVLHEPGRARLRAREPARGREGRALRPLLAVAQEPAAPLPGRVRRRPRPHRRSHRRRHHRAPAGRGALRPGVLRVRRRLGGPARRRAPGLRAGVEPADQDPRVGPPHGLPRAVDPLHPLRQPPRRPVPVLARPGDRPLAAGGALRGRPRRALRHVRPHASRAHGVGARPVPEGARRLGLRVQADDQGQGV